jgi:hypothetical protein
MIDARRRLVISSVSQPQTEAQRAVCQQVSSGWSVGMVLCCSKGKTPGDEPKLEQQSADLIGIAHETTYSITA